MPQFCDVALPVPLDSVFTYRVNGTAPVVGGRVLVPFRTERLPGIVVALHDRPPSVAAKNVFEVLDTSPVLDAELMKLAEWMAGYYLAPLGEVFRTMLPLAAEVRRAWQYEITETGLAALHAGATQGSSRRSQRTAEEQDIEYAVLNRLADGPAREGSLRSATGAARALLAGMARKKWIARADITATRDAARTVKVIVRAGESNGHTEVHEGGAKGHEGNDGGAVAAESGRGTKPKGRALNANQERLLAAVSAAGERLTWEDFSALAIPRSTLDSLVRRGLLAIVNEPAAFHLSSLPPKTADLVLNPAQNEALERITRAANAGFSVSLLHGVTGSGKTAIYLAAMRRVLDSGRSALLLVPEIGLTPAAVAEVAQTFGNQVALLHSALSDDERAEQWHRIRRGEARVVVGTRSAVFAPLCDLALIVVDEEHDGSYKQEETPRYHARDVAVMRGKLAGAAVVLGSATPSLESFHNAQRKKYGLIELRERVEQRPLPEVEIVDMRAEFQRRGEDAVISARLHEEIAARLARSEQVLVLLNRRGYAPVVLCRACGKTAECANCAISLTHHLGKARLECHYCGYNTRVPKTCPECGSEYVQFLGTGSERLEELMHGLFPQARIARLDRDTVRGRHDFERILGRLHGGELDILVGTQMIAKGHDVHGVTLVGIVGADLALGFPDFRSAERTFQLITQVAGRAGRGTTPGRVILQTYFPDHYAIQFAARHDYLSFADKELRFRRWMHYPPVTALANVLVRSAKLDECMAITGTLGRWLQNTRLPGVRVLGPAPAPLARLKRDYRYHFVLKAESRNALNAALRALVGHATEEKIARSNLIVDVDALSLL